MIDTAASYFKEEQVDNAIRHSGLKREEVFVTTKLWVQDYEYEDVLRAFDKSMKQLGLDYFDLYLLHKPYGNYYAAWRACEKLYKEGRIRAISVTSFSNERLQDLFLHNEVKPAVNQLETYPFFQQKGRSPIYDDIDLATTKFIGTHNVPFLCQCQCSHISIILNVPINSNRSLDFGIIHGQDISQKRESKSQ